MGTLNEDLQGIKTVEDTLTSNKVSRFAYTEEAYTANNANGVDIFDPDAGQNIPNPTPSIMQVNQSVVEYGWRAQASSLTRMLMNHFLGRLSYNLNKVNDNMSNLLSTFISHLGTANGVATLDSNGRIPYSQLPESAIEYKGNWDASTNTTSTGLHLANGTGVQGDFYICTVAGTCDFGAGAITFLVNDRVIYDGSVWTRLSAGDVRTVCNKTPDSNGNVALVKGDLGLGSVVNTGDSAMPVQNGTTKFTTGGAYEALLNLAPYFSSSTSYSVGSYVTYQGKLYKCITAHSGAWNGSHFQLTVATNDPDYSIEETLLNKKWIDGKAIYRKVIKRQATSPFEATYRNILLLYTSSAQCNALYEYNGKLYAGIASKGIYVSSDGVNFTQNTSFPNNYSALSFFEYNGNLYVGTSSHGIYISTDGTTFTQNTSLTNSYTTLSFFEYGGKLYVGTRSHGIYISTNGTIFTQNTSFPTGYSVHSLFEYNGKLYVGTENRGIYISTNGTTFTQNTSFPTGYYVYAFFEYDGKLYVGTMSHGIYVSSDGVNFTQNTSFPTVTVRSLLRYNGKLYVGTEYVMYSSTDGTTFIQDTSFSTGVTFLSFFEYNGKLYVGTSVDVRLLEVKALVIPFENVTTILDCKLLSGKRFTQAILAYSNDSNLEVTVSNEAIIEDGYDTAIIEYTKE